MKYTVIRQHFGDKHYMPGDEREANETDVSHLVANGVLRKMQPKAKNKAAPAVSNKAAK